MALVAAFADIASDQVRKVRVTGIPGKVDGTGSHAPFFSSSSAVPDSPAAYLSRFDPGRVAIPHYHAVDQFQILVEGSGKFGRHDVAPYCVHFSRAFTPYGPLQADAKTGWAYIGLRVQHDPGPQRFAEQKLREMRDRQPWQITKKVVFPAQASGVNLQPIPEIADNRGLFVDVLTMAPNTRINAPDPSKGAGQFLVLLKGSLLHSGREFNSYTIAFVRPHEESFEIHAGSRGLEALVLNFPKRNSATSPI